MIKLNWVEKNIMGIKSTGCDYSHQTKEQNATCVFMPLIIIHFIWKVNTPKILPHPEGLFALLTTRKTRTAHCLFLSTIVSLARHYVSAARNPWRFRCTSFAKSTWFRTIRCFATLPGSFLLVQNELKNAQTGVFEFVAHPEGFEPSVFWSVVRRFIQLSYGCNGHHFISKYSNCKKKL